MWNELACLHITFATFTRFPGVCARRPSSDAGVGSWSVPALRACLLPCPMGMLSAPAGRVAAMLLLAGTEAAKEQCTSTMVGDYNYKTCTSR